MRRTLLATIACLAVAAVVPPPFVGTSAAAVGPAGFSTLDLLDVSYCQNDGVDLKLDFQHAATDAVTPLVVHVHGGGWIAGDKSHPNRYLDDLRDRGYSTASINYRLAPEFPFPAQIVDVKCAIRYLRVHADSLGVDPDAFAVFGGSAGGHLALLAGFADPTAGFDIGENARVSSRVDAVIEMSGVSDVTDQDFRSLHPDIIRDVFLDDRDLMRDGSPLQWVDAADPAVFILHGTDDRVVPVDQALSLDVALRDAGVAHKTVIVEGGGHMLRTVNGETSGGDVLDGYAASMADFLDVRVH